jgi:ADP-ribose pyrophosphatase YjhB (NUDIX family)
MVGSMVLVERGDEVLLVRPVYRGGWTLPGGVVDRGESPLDAGVREVGEEVGVKVRPAGRSTVVVDAAARRIDVIVVASLEEPGAQPAAVSAEIRAVGWFPRGQLPDLVFEAHTAFAALEEPHRVPWVIPPGLGSSWMD